MKKVIILLIAVVVTVCVVAQGVPSNVPTNGLVAYYGFDGNANDLSGNGNNGTLGCDAGASNPTLTADRFGAANKAYEFAGVDGPNWIKVNSSGSLQFNGAMTVSFWMKQQSPRGGNISAGGQYNIVANGAYFTPIAKGGDGNPTGESPAVSAGWRVRTSYSASNTQEVHYLNTASDVANSDLSYSATFKCYSASQWIHVVFVVKPNLARCYINGVLYSEMSNLTPNFAVSNTKPMYFGRQEGGSRTYFPYSGALDDIAIYNRALDDSEVDRLFNNYRDPQGDNNRVTVNSVAVVNPCGSTLGTITLNPRQESGVNYRYSLDSPNDPQTSNVLQATPGEHRCYVITDCALWDTIITLVCDCAGDPSLTYYDSICPGECGQRGSINTIYSYTFDSWGSGPTRWTHGGSSGLDWSIGRGEPNYLEAMQWAPSHSGHTGNSAWYPTYQGYVSRYDGYAITPPINISCDPQRATLKFWYIAEMIEDWIRGYNTFKVYYSTSISGPWTQLWSSGGGDIASWRQATVSLSRLPSSGTYYFKFASEGDGYVSALDDVEITCDDRWNVPDEVCLGGEGETVRTENVLSNTGLCPITEVTLWYIRPRTESHEYVTVPPPSYTWHGQTYRQNGTYSWNNNGQLKNHFGCDSTVYLHLTLDINNYGDDNQVACDSLVWNGRTYYASTEDSVSCTACNRYGGDSTTYLHLVINRSSARSIDTVSCLPFEWQGTTYDSSFTAMAPLFTTVGHCDSLVTVHYTRHFPDETFVIDTACDDETYYFAGTVLDHSGEFTARLRNRYLCDSTVHLNLAYFRSYDFPQMVDTVSQDSLPYTGYNYITGQDYSYELHNELVHFRALGGCDSNYHLTLIIRYNFADCDGHLQFPNVITPNGDNHNDRFYIVGIENGCWPENELIIYNRWGTRIFSTRNMKSGLDCWEPTFAPAGTYYFRFQGRSSRGVIERFGVVEVVK